MKKQIIKKRFSFIVIIIFFVTIPAINSSCKKVTTAEDKTIDTPPGSAIIYTDVNPDSAILQIAPALYKLDMNNDDVADFEFDRSRILLCNDYETGSVGYAANLSLTPLSVNNAVIINRSGLAALDSSKVITRDSLWATTSQTLLYGVISASGHCHGSIYGNWINISDKYMGLKFSKNNQTYYGWARLSCSYHRNLVPYRPLIVVGQLILKDYAYNSSPNQPILAGQKK